MTTPETPTLPPRPAPGMIVTSKHNSDWGAGTVMTVQGDRAQVLFAHHPARKPVVVPWKSLVIVRAGQWESAAQAMHLKASGSSSGSGSTSAPKKKKLSTKTQAQAVAGFFERFPGGFGDEKFLSEERNHRWNAHLAFERELGGSKLPELLAAARVEDVVQHALQAAQDSKLLSVFDKARLSKALRADPGYAQRVFQALAELLAPEAPEEKSFAAYLDALQTGPEKGKKLTWPIATILPYLADPVHHLFLKPVATQAAAERLSFDLQYQTAPSWNTYARALKLASALQESLRERGCRDFVDVQAFISATQ